ncbi:3D-(3,5/4)-trihydroxycyclohexane-1,2-dione acylhydrolase (decyclizing) [Pseudovibrio ascidiaceicola]|uniref:3D-(3,5/4)-trihydroxycyclohexane-1,2-dione acylhydrolase (Decyclizing) n=1 Tax=Pseudovibrio ascidiaceicola TaxID=285279 RepID=A0A1I4DQW0_9HYPH|nr:thiamine pyrophosphate-dependent enzyme [Pseudovibrio ascidiaceicola]SFK95030.1 3D-(3,5/4)-trihydroxycyclohexane-1,2-dione acylhydrolase (decyclizing) [Pseudovibrio ascidiaceicola]
MSLSVPGSMQERANWLQAQGGLEAAITAGHFAEQVTMTLSEALVLGLMRQGVTKYLAIFGHGSTELGEVLRVYEDAGLVRTWQFRNEVEMAHAGTALRWVYGEVCAVVTSIGPGALQAMAGSLAAASNGIGLYHIYGDETTYGEGYNMQQVPKPQQGLFQQITSAMSQAYTLHTPEALRSALRMGASCVYHPFKAAPFYLNLPLNTQPQKLDIRLDSLPTVPTYEPTIPAVDHNLLEAVERLKSTSKIAIKAGGGSRPFAEGLRSLAEAAGAVVVEAPGSLGILPDSHPQNMHVGGSKGSISGNHAMQEAELLVAIGSRAVCQSDCSGMGWPKAKHVININADPMDVQHYAHTTALNGDIGEVVKLLLAELSKTGVGNKADWLKDCATKKSEWTAFKAELYAAGAVNDEVWQGGVMTQPQAIKAASDFCKKHGAIKLFDAGDVQANGFQVVEDDRVGETITETGASYMGFAVSALIAGGIADEGKYSVAFTGDGSFMMNPQVLIDGVEHGVHGTVLIFDNRRMAAISHLQLAQYGNDYRTNDGVAVDYIAMANAVDGVLAISGGHSAEDLSEALEKARAHKGLSVVHVPVYHGENPVGGMGAYGNWNVGNWCKDVQDKYLKMSI